MTLCQALGKGFSRCSKVFWSRCHRPLAWTRHSRSCLIESSARDPIATRARLTLSQNVLASSSRMRPTMSTVRDVRANESSDRGIPRRSRMKSLATHRLECSAPRAYKRSSMHESSSCTSASETKNLVRIIETRKVKKMKGKCVNLTRC